MAEELRLVLTPPVLKILVDGTNVLWDPTTSEQVVLGKGKFVVEQDSAVEPSYVYDENDEDSMPKWVPDLFYFKVYRNSNGDLFIQDSLERSRASLKEFQCASRSIKVHIALPGSCTPSAFMVWHNKGATTGCHVWWSLFDIATATIVPHGRGRLGTKRWKVVQDRWPAWCNLARRMHLPEPIKPSRLQYSKDPTPQLERSEEQRWYTHPTATTTTMLSILVQLSCATASGGGCSDARMTEAAKSLCSTMLCMVPIGGLCLSPVSYTKSCECFNYRTGLMEQRHLAPPVPVSMAYGLVDIRSFTSGIRSLGQLDGIINEVLDTWPEVCNIMEFVMLLYRDSRSMLMQCIWQIAMAIDKQLSEEVGAVVYGKTCLDPKFAVEEESSGGLSVYQRGLQLVKHVHACRQHCSRWPKMMSFGTDAARVAFKTRANLAVVLPDNTGMWAPPQAGSVAVVGFFVYVVVSVCENP